MEAPHPNYNEDSIMRTILLAIAITLITGSVIFADDWPQWRGPTRDGAWLEEEVVRAFVEKELKPRWRVPYGGVRFF